MTGDGVRTDPLTLKATVEVVQLVGQARVVNGVGALGLQLVICSTGDGVTGSAYCCVTIINCHLGLWDHIVIFYRPND